MKTPPFDVEKAVRETIRKIVAGKSKNFGFEDIVALCHRCADEALEKAADLVWRNPHDSTFDANRHAKLIRSLKTRKGSEGVENGR